MIKTMYKSFDDLPAVITVKQYAEYEGISYIQAYRIFMSQGFPRRQLCKGGKLVVRKEKLNKWITEQEKQAQYMVKYI